MASLHFKRTRSEVREKHCDSLLRHGCAPQSVSEKRRKRREYSVKRFHHVKHTSSPYVRSASTVVLSLLLALFCTSLLGTVSASIHGDQSAPPIVDTEDDPVRKRSPLLIDRRPPPIPPLLMPAFLDEDEISDAHLAQQYKRAITTDPNGDSGDFTVPQPLDTALSNNYTSSCINFFNRVRTSDNFVKCHPFSLLLQTSSGFFDASKSYLRITQTLDATCGVNATQCKKTMDDLSREFQTASACKTDLANDNPLVIQTLNGLLAYPVAYAASCLRDDEGKYCYANAVTNLTATSDSLPYYLAVGQELPGSSRPTCNSCLQQTMAIFAQSANNSTQPIYKTYNTAAQQISISCGRTFVNVTAAPLKGAASTTSSTLIPHLSLLVMLILFLFQ